MKNTLRIGHSHLNGDGLIDGMNLYRALAPIEAAVILESLGSSLEQIKSEFGVRVKTNRFDVRFEPCRVIELGDECLIESYLYPYGTRVGIRHYLSVKGLEVLTVKHDFCFFDERPRITDVPRKLFKRLRDKRRALHAAQLEQLRVLHDPRRTP
jgi:hypothetical protein